MIIQLNKVRLIFFFSFLLGLIANNIQAQPVLHQLNQFFSQDVEHQAAAINNTWNAGVKPFVNGVNYNKQELDSLYFQCHNVKSYKNIWLRKLKQESLIHVDSPTFKLALDPLFYFEGGRDLKYSDSLYFTNTRGVLLRGSLGQNLAFESAFFENQAFFPDYLSRFIRENEVVPGQGRVKKYKQSGFDFAQSTGVFSYSPIRFLNIMAGSGKLFVGNGYRSLLLSDNAFSYPYLKINFHGSRWSYTAAWASFQIIKNGRFVFYKLSEPIYTKKAYTFQYVTIRPIKRIELGFFQGVMWQEQTQRNNNFDPNLLNPLIFSHAFQYGLYYRNNIILGANLNIKITSYINFYSQFVIDDWKNKKIGIQAGVKYFDVGGIKNLYLQAEYNKVNPYTYSYPYAFRSFTHYNQALAHPLGANFNEIVGLVNYRFKDFFVAAKLNLMTYGKDTLKYFAGNNIMQNYLLSEMQSNTMLRKALVQYTDLKLGYVVNKASNLNIAAGALLRNQSGALGGLQTHYFYLSIGTTITNKYYDF